MGRDHPVSWCRDIDDGRTWYTGIGNSAAVFADAQVRLHLRGGIETALGGPAVECGATIWRNFQKVQLTREVGEPMDLAVLPDRRVLMTDRRGRLRMHKPDTGEIKLAAEIPVYAGEEDGLQTVAIDPDFETNHWVYLYYARPESAPCSQPDINGGVIKCGVNRLSRFKLEGDTLNLATEQTIIEVPTQRDLCCHVGGDVGFDSQGNLLPDDRRQHELVGVGRLLADRRASRPRAVRRAALVGQHQRPARQAAAHQGRRRRQLHGARRQPVRPRGPLPGRDRQDAARDLLDGPPQPVPLRRRPGDRLGLHGRGRARTPRSDNTNRGPRQYEELNIIKRAGNGGWPHCIGSAEHRRALGLPRLGLRDRAAGPGVRLRRRPDQRLAEQHRPDAASARRQPADHLVPVRRLRAVPRARQRRRHRDGRAGLPLRRRACSPTPSGRPTSRAARSSTSGRARS